MKTRTKKYTEAELVSFGDFLLSEERKANFQPNETGLSVEERLAMVHHADLENWKNNKQAKKIY